MKLEVECRTATEAEAAIRDGNIPLLMADMRIEISANVRIKCMAGIATLVALGASQPSIEAWGSSRPSIVAWGSSRPSIVARESSQPSIVARESSQPSIVAWESSRPSIVASGVCQVSLRGSVNIKAGGQVAIAVVSGSPTIEGGGYVARLDISTPAKWCEYYGVEVSDGCAVLYKALNDEFCANYNGFKYLPGETQRAADWDPNPARECGGGLHFSPTPRHAQQFHPSATRFCGVRVALATLLVHPDGESPHKCRGPETLECFEVDINGKRLPAQEAAE